MRRSSLLALPLRQPEDVIPHLGKPTHWKQGRSAKALADAWFRSGGNVPLAVKALLDQSPILANAELLDGWLERETDLKDGRSTPSQTDLLALLGLDDSLAVIGIEAKVDESFGPIVSDWLGERSEGKSHRLKQLCKMFGVNTSQVGHLRYQLLHRTAATILEAKRFRTDSAVLIVQSFCPKSTGLAEARAFFDAINMPGLEAGKLIGAKQFSGVNLWVGWAHDQVWNGTKVV